MILVLNGITHHGEYLDRGYSIRKI